jgi:hypothetical protein
MAHGPAPGWGKEGGRHGESNLANTEAWKAARRRRTGGGTLARRGDDVGAVKAKRRSVGGVGVCGGGRVPSMTGVEGASMLPI